MSYVRFIQGELKIFELNFFLSVVSKFSEKAF